MDQRPIVIYLDQNKWIDLARADHGHRLGAPFVESLQLLEREVLKGGVIVPIGKGHYIETWNTGNIGQRQRLAMTMAKLSNFRTLIDPWELRRLELTAALRARFGDDIGTKEVEFIGKGIRHVFQGVDWQSEEPDFKQSGGQTMWVLYQTMILANVLNSYEAAKQSWQQAADGNIVNTKALDGLFQRRNSNRHERHETLRLEELKQVFETAVPVLKAAGISWGAITAQPKGWLQALLEELPFLYTAHQLLVALYDNPHLPRKRSNFVDVFAMAQAIVCCDVVVTERQWVHIAKACKLDERNRTTMLADVNGLTTLLKEPVGS